MKPQPGSLDPSFFLGCVLGWATLTHSGTCVLEALTLVQLRPRGEGRGLKSLAMHDQVSFPGLSTFGTLARVPDGEGCAYHRWGAQSPWDVRGQACSAAWSPDT